ncbi:hypothetical protein EDB89DRAFT_2079107 [Lactarius sanguifluus]|nr:hypothetical protein EDB89DRAFT_2079107 [Lactarius sanguifluus]
MLASLISRSGFPVYLLALIYTSQERVATSFRYLRESHVFQPTTLLLLDSTACYLRYDNVAPQCCDINTSRLRYDTHTPCESYTDATNTDSDVAPQCYDTADAALQCYDINTARQHYDTHTLRKPSGDVTTPICRASPPATLRHHATRKPSGDVTTPIRCASPAATLRR